MSTPRRPDEASTGPCALPHELVAELSAMRRLHELSTRLLADGELAPMLEDTLACMMALQSADCGCVQLYDSASRRLDVVAQRNLPAALLPQHDIVTRGAEPLIIEDLHSDAGDRELALPWPREAGMRALHATPLTGRGGQWLGMIITGFGRPHRPPEHELRMADLCARQAAQLVERKRVETALRRSQAYLAAAERLSHSGSWAWNPASRELYWSDEMFALFGRDPACGAPSYEATFDRLYPQDAGPLRSAFEAAVEAHSEYEAEWRIVQDDGSLRYMHSHAQPVFDAQGRLLEYLGTVTDITPRKRSEAALAQAHDELAHLTRVMSMNELAASIAHEVSQPLAAIVTNGNACLRWLAREPAQVDEARRAVERIVRDGARAGEVVGRIRAYVSKTAPQPHALDMNDVVRQSLALAHGEALRGQLIVSTQLQGALPLVHGDRIQLQQVMVNLIINAIDAMRSVLDRPRELLLRTSADDTSVTVSVRDAGVGLDAHAAQRLFDPFFTTKAGGMGLGLAISRRIIEAHGGRIWADANASHGATLSFSIPTRRPAPSA